MSGRPAGEIVLYQRDDVPAIDVRLDGNTVWLSLNQIADLLGRDKSTISRHITNVFSEGELMRHSVVAEFATTAADGKTYRVEHFNLDVIISVGYRVKSRQGTQFRIWATERLREYLVKGFAMDDTRLKNLGGGSYWKELLDRIRDIRSSEKVLYRQVLDLYATSVDYDPKAEAGNAKNYLHVNELKRLNALVSAYFDAAEFRAMNHEATYMKDWLSHLEQMIAAMGGKTLQGAGKVSHQQALTHAEAEYAKFRSQQDVIPSEVETAYLEAVKKVQKKVSDKKKP